MCAMRDLQREGGVCLGVPATGNRWQHKGKPSKAVGEWAVLGYAGQVSAALLIGATFYRARTAVLVQFIRYIKHFASCGAATGTNNAHARPNVTCLPML